MADLILWNSIAGRMRSPSDTFLENGLALLASSLETKGISVDIEDWALTERWNEISPSTLVKINGKLTDIILSRPGRQTLKKRLVSPFFFLCQNLTAAMQRKAQKARIRALAIHIAESGFLVAGVKTWYGEAFSNAKYFAEVMKEIAPQVITVAGGPHASIYRETLLKNTAFDLAVAGEGESPLAAIIERAKKAGSKQEALDRIGHDSERGAIANLIYRRDGKVMPGTRQRCQSAAKQIPVYRTLEGKIRIHVLVDSLGCPWSQCSFCTHSKIYDSYSTRDPRDVVEEIERMRSAGIGIFRFAGSATTIEQAEAISRQVLAKGLKIKFSMFSRVIKDVHDAQNYRSSVTSFRVIINAGMRAIFIGAESASDTVNELVMNKGISRRDILYTVKAIREAAKLEETHVDIGISLIYPVPTMGRVSLNQVKLANLDLVRRTMPDSVLVSPPAPFPGTEWYEEKDKYGFELGHNFAADLLSYDYVLYKPVSMWPEIQMKLQGASLKDIFSECQSLRNEIENNQVATEITDEHFLMARAAGYSGREGALQFKRNALKSILSCNYEWVESLREKINEYSESLARSGNDDRERE